MAFSFRCTPAIELGEPLVETCFKEEEEEEEEEAEEGELLWSPPRRGEPDDSEWGLGAGGPILTDDEDDEDEVDDDFDEFGAKEEEVC
jgi:hypothetical protein